MSEASSSDTRRVVAAFDFDGTISRRDTLLPFLARVRGWRRVALALARQSPGLARMVVARADRDRVKEAVLGRLLGARSAAELAATGALYANELAHGKRLRNDVLERARWHRAQGHELVLVSASLAAYLDVLGPRLRFDTVLATRLEVDGAGRLTGRFEGGNVRGPEKAARLREWLATGPPAVLWAYGDSRGDRELLALADFPRWVGRRGLPPSDTER